MITNREKRAAVLRWAESQVGVMEYPPGTNSVKYNDWFYGGPGRDYAWCMTFVQWVFDRACLPLPVRTASCTVLANWAKGHGQWVTENYQPGDILFFHWGRNPHATEHVGIVKEVRWGDAPCVVTWEGNTSIKDQTNGGCVMERTRFYSNITGAYRPWYNF